MNSDQIKTNFEKEPLEVIHSGLERFGDSIFKSKCISCEDGLLLMKRNEKGILQKDDTCVACGRRYIYIDVEENNVELKYK